MENLKPLVVGIFVGASLVYLLQDCDCPVEEIQKCEETKKVILESSQESESEEVEIVKENTETKILVKPKERMKTPDELYEEQELERNYSDIEEVPIEEDRDILPIELEQIEMSSVSNIVPEVDINIVSEELQGVEQNVVEPTIVSEFESRDLDVEITESTLETKEVITEELMDLEEFGDSEGIPMEEDIPN